MQSVSHPSENHTTRPSTLHVLLMISNSSIIALVVLLLLEDVNKYFPRGLDVLTPKGFRVHVCCRKALGLNDYCICQKYRHEIWGH